MLRSAVELECRAVAQSARKKIRCLRECTVFHRRNIVAVSLPSVHFCFLRRANQASCAALTAAGLLPDIPRTDSLGSETRDLSSIELRCTHTHARARTHSRRERARERERESRC